MTSPVEQPLASDPGRTDRSSSDSAPAPQARRSLSAPAIASPVQRAPAAEDMAAVATPAVKVEIRNINFFYGKFQALHNVSLPLYDRRVTAFIIRDSRFGLGNHGRLPRGGRFGAG